MTTEEVEDAEYELKMGDRWPYDASYAWHNIKGATPPPPVDWAHRAARGVISKLCDNNDIDDALGIILDDNSRTEIVKLLADIIRLAEQQKSG